MSILIIIGGIIWLAIGFWVAGKQYGHLYDDFPLLHSRKDHYENLYFSLAWGFLAGLFGVLFLAFVGELNHRWRFKP